ncbi:plastocyanin/azurin family copper-binding protein [Streptacidiphilus sp. N1-12]|uniref:Plastocyanin/azurin family copper-binding protein n=2 Tax=Streptacidiphilus alkalitolerans TaxID=3342712 RepID=A0ABV6VDT7_9ACTN
MNLRAHQRRPHLLRLASLGLAALSTSVLLAACGSPSHPAAASTALSPGAGQSLAGTPGSTATGPLATGSAMPGMSMGASAPGGSAAAAVPVNGDTVAIKGFAFAPAALVVKAGTTVTWTNQDGDAHTVTSQGSGGPLNSPALATGQSYSYRFTTPGTYAYLCTIHPFMTATVTVTK